MPKPFELSNQKGSVLAGVLALSIAMTAIAGGYVVLSGNTAGRRLDAMEDLRLHYAAEAGAQLGVRWLKEYEPKYYSNWSSDDKIQYPPLWTNPIPIIQDGINIDDFFVSVWLDTILNPGGPPSFKLRSEATRGPDKETLVITWRINSANPGTSPAKSKPFLDNWVESYKPGKP